MSMPAPEATASFSPMRRRLPLLVVPLLLVSACSGDEPTEAASGGTDTEVTEPRQTPDELCEQLMIAAASDDPLERQGAFAVLHDELPEKDGLHDALTTLEVEREKPEDGEALNAAMTVLNDELHCGG